MLRGSSACPSRYGHNRSTTDHLMTPLSRAVRMPNIPAATSMRLLSPGVLDQGQTGECLPHAGVVAIYASLRAAGLPTILGDPSIAYKGLRSWRRAVAGMDPETHPLFDTGSTPDEFEAFLERFGLAPFQAPASVATVNDEVNLAQLEMSAVCKMTGAYAVASADDVCLALASGIVPTSAFYVYDAFEQFSGGRILTPKDNVGTCRGAHCVAIVGYETMANGTRIFEWQNSWGNDWGDGGYFKTDEAWVNACFNGRAMKMRKVA